MGLLSKVTDAVGITDTGAGGRGYAAQAAAAAEANKTLKEMYADAKTRNQPWADQGLEGFNSLSDMAMQDNRFSTAENPMRNSNGVFSANDFQKDPGYQFRLSEGMKGVQNSAAAGGSLNSGATLKALARYGQGFASNEYQNAYDRFNQDYSNSYNRFNADNSNRFNQLNTVANYGQNANNAIGNAGANAANSIAQNQIGLGNSAANMELNAGNQMKDLWKMGMQGAAMMCWVARAVFGESNPKWRFARHFIENLGPTWFKNLYLKHGEAFAKRVEKNKLLKFAITPIFEIFALLGGLDLFKVKEVNHAN